MVENSTLSAVAPPDITYNLAMPASILSEGKLSNLQLEAIVYGCQRHTVNLPLNPELSNKDAQPLRAGFLLGDGAGMGKGRTLAGFVVENIARGRKRHVWISVSSDLYEGEQDCVVGYSSMYIGVTSYDAFQYSPPLPPRQSRRFILLDAKRDLSDLGMETYAEEKCFLLGKLPYNNLSKKYPEGVMFATYQTLIGKNRGEKTRLDQLIQWCGGEDFNGLIM